MDELSRQHATRNQKRRNKASLPTMTRPEFARKRNSGVLGAAERRCLSWWEDIIVSQRNYPGFHVDIGVARFECSTLLYGDSSRVSRIRAEKIFLAVWRYAYRPIFGRFL